MHSVWCHPEVIPALHTMFLGLDPDSLWPSPGWNSYCKRRKKVYLFIFLFLCVSFVFCQFWVLVRSCTWQGGCCGRQIQRNTCTHILLVHDIEGLCSLCIVSSMKARGFSDLFHWMDSYPLSRTYSFCNHRCLYCVCKCFTIFPPK